MFVKIHRGKLIKKKLKSKDQGFLFVSEKTGLKINANSLGNDNLRSYVQAQIYNKYIY